MPFRSQSRTAPLESPVATVWPSGDIATVYTVPGWVQVAAGSPPGSGYSFAVWSEEPDTSVRPSAATARDTTIVRCSL